ncbi:hypothetical protein JYU34_018222, partial [Plutella xylostella]
MELLSICLWFREHILRSDQLELGQLHAAITAAAETLQQQLKGVRRRLPPAPPIPLPVDAQ